jgi:hypothetical protein
MNESISKDQRVVYGNTNTKIPLHVQGALGMHGRIQGRVRQSFDAI